MKDESKRVASRREFIQLAVGSSAIATTAAIAPGATGAAGRAEDLRCRAVENSRWKPGESTGRRSIQKAQQSLLLNGTWLATALPLEAEGETGYSAFKKSTESALSVQVP